MSIYSWCVWHLGQKNSYIIRTCYYYVLCDCASSFEKPILEDFLLPALKSTRRGLSSGLKHIVEIKCENILLPYLLVGVFSKTFSSLLQALHVYRNIRKIWTLWAEVHCDCRSGPAF
jgi:hypothetical protein